MGDEDAARMDTQKLTSSQWIEPVTRRDRGALAFEGPWCRRLGNEMHFTKAIARAMSGCSHLMNLTSGLTKTLGRELVLGA